MVDLAGPVHGGLGAPDLADAAETVQSIELCAEFVRRGEAKAIVTNPIAKEVLQNAGFAHPGHTEFLGELARRLFHAERQSPSCCSGPINSPSCRQRSMFRSPTCRGF